MLLLSPDSNRFPCRSLPLPVRVSSFSVGCRVEYRFGLFACCVFVAGYRRPRCFCRRASCNVAQTSARALPVSRFRVISRETLRFPASAREPAISVARERDKDVCRSGEPIPGGRAPVSLSPLMLVLTFLAFLFFLVPSTVRTKRQGRTLRPLPVSFPFVTSRRNRDCLLGWAGGANQIRANTGVLSLSRVIFYF